MTYLSDETGATAAEYGLILAVIAVGVIVAMSNLGHVIKAALLVVSNAVNTGS